MLETILNGFYTGAVASVICLLYCHFRLANLTVAGWCCLFSWVAAALVMDLPFADRGVICLIGVGLVSIMAVAASVFYRGHLFTAHPTLYLFLGLACHVVISIGGGNSIASSIGTTLPGTLLDKTFLSAHLAQQVALGLICLLMPVVVHFLLRTRFVARLVLNFRSESTLSHHQSLERGTRIGLLKLLGIQLLLCLVLGAVGAVVNQGNFSLTTKHMATSTLAAIATNGSPLWAFGAATVLSIFESVAYKVYPDATLAYAASLALFVAVTTIVTKKTFRAGLAAPNQWLRSLSLSKWQYMGQVAFIGLSPWLMYKIWPYMNLSQSRLITISSILVFANLSFVAARCCGIATASFPALGAAIVICLSLSHSVGVTLIVGLLCACYMILLRYSHHRVALVMDLVLILSVHELLASKLITGADAIVSVANWLPAGDSSDRFEFAFRCIFFLNLVAIAVVSLMHLTVRGKVVAHAISDPFLARQNGLMSLLALSGICFLCLIITGLVQSIKCSNSHTISPSEAEPLLGIGCLLMGYLMASRPPIQGYLIGLAFYVLPEDFFPGLGEYAKLFILVPILCLIYWSPERRLNEPTDEPART